MAVFDGDLLLCMKVSHDGPDARGPHKRGGGKLVTRVKDSEERVKASLQRAGTGRVAGATPKATSELRCAGLRNGPLSTQKQKGGINIISFPRRKARAVVKVKAGVMRSPP